MHIFQTDGLNELNCIVFNDFRLADTSRDRTFTEVSILPHLIHLPIRDSCQRNCVRFILVTSLACTVIVVILPYVLNVNLKSTKRMKLSV